MAEILRSLSQRDESSARIRIEYEFIQSRPQLMLGVTAGATSRLGTLNLTEVVPQLNSDDSFDFQV